jgi:FAD dependent oxidoreductase TIGR03364
MTLERVVIVGGGVIGTMHAREACRRGWEVVHLEADPGPRRASVRNFGLVWVSGRAPGPELDLALRARELWEQIAGQAPDVGFRPDGSLTIAGDDTGAALLAEAASQPDAAARGFELLDTAGVRSVNPSVRGDIGTGLWCRHDAVVEPGRVLGALRRELETTGRYRWSPGRQAVDVSTGGLPSGTGATVIDQRGDHHQGSLVLLCLGDRLTGLGGRVGAALSAAPLRRCRLQMMQTAPTGERVSTAIADGDSMRYYPAFDLPGRRRLSPARSETAAWGMQLLLVQRADGGLTIGDTHAYEEPFDFALSEDPTHELLARAERILGTPPPPVCRRWEGVYAQCTDGGVCAREELSPGVWMVTGPGGRGMTCAPAIAADTLTAAGVT